MLTKVENYCAGKESKSISIDSGEHACINCIWYEQYYRENRGNVRMWVPTSTGNCLLKDEQRKALSYPCESYEGYELQRREEEERRDHERSNIWATLPVRLRFRRQPKEERGS